MIIAQMSWVARIPWWKALSIMLRFEFYPEENGELWKGCKAENTQGCVEAIMKADEVESIKKIENNKHHFWQTLRYFSSWVHSHCPFMATAQWICSEMPHYQ